MKCLVTGGAGFIGSHIAEALLRRGDKVRILDNLSAGTQENLDAIGKKAEFFLGDLKNISDVEKAVTGIDVIFHHAAMRSVPKSVDMPLASNENNVTGTLNLLIAARKSGVKRVIYASSSSVYGNNKTFPQSETLIPAPRSPYAVSKLAAEHYCVMYAKTLGLETVSLRYFNVFGPRQALESKYAVVVPKFMAAAISGDTLEVHSDGKQSRDFTYIDNVVQGNLLAASAKNVAGEVFNLACGENYSLLDIIRVLEKLCGKKLKRKHSSERVGDVRRTWADMRKAKKLLGYKPSVSFEDGLARTWDWFSKGARK